MRFAREFGDRGITAPTKLGFSAMSEAGKGLPALPRVESLGIKLAA